MEEPRFAALAELGEIGLQQAHALYQEYLADPSDPPWRDVLLPRSGPSLGFLLAGGVVGIAYGGPARRQPGCLILRGIAVAGAHAQKGRGSLLLYRFEEQARAAGFNTVSVGSAGGYVDRFYAKNGYRCVAYLVDPPAGTDGPEQRRRPYADYIGPAESAERFRVDTAAMDEALRARFLADFDGAGLNAIMDKDIRDAPG